MKPTWIATAIFALVSLALLGKGITGMYTLDFKLPYCTADTACSDTCCQFYNAGTGICATKKECPAILAVTQEEYQKTSQLQIDQSTLQQRQKAMVKAHLEAPAKQSNLNMILVGIVLAVLAVISLFIKPEK